MASRSQPLVFRGYTKKENGRWVAICIDLNIVAQGSSSDEATQKCGMLISDYLDYVRTTYSDEIDKYMHRSAPQEFIDEYYRIVGSSVQHKTQASADVYNFRIEPDSLS